MISGKRLSLFSVDFEANKKSREKLPIVAILPAFIVQRLDYTEIKKSVLSDRIKIMHGEHNPITYFAYTNFRNARQRFGIYQADRRHHMYIIGKTGMGKTTLMENMIKSDISQNNGFAVFDPHGDLAVRALKHIPKKRKNDLILFDPSIKKLTLPFNLLSVTNPNEKHLVCAGIISVLKKVYIDFWGPRLEHVLRNAILTLLHHPGCTLSDVSKLLTNSTYRARMIKNVGDDILQDFWQSEFDKYQARFRQEVISPILNKVGQFNTHPVIRKVIGQPKDRIRIDKILDDKKIFIANLSKGAIGEDATSLLGAALITKFQLAAQKRVVVPEYMRKDFYLYIDEFQEFVTDSFITLLPEARKFRLNVILSNQYLDQIPESIRNSILGNVGTLACFRLGLRDAKTMAEEFLPKFSQEDLLNLPRFMMYLKLMVNGIGSEGFSASIG